MGRNKFFTPRILFSSDLHGKKSVFEAFSHQLQTGDFAFGILGGDLHDEYLPDPVIQKLTGCSADDLLDEIGSDSQSSVDLWRNSRARKLMDQAIAVRITLLQDVLRKAGKPIYFVLGNHDRVEWPENPLMTDIHLRRIELEGWNLVGYRWTSPERAEELLDADLPQLNHLIDSRTVLVTHSPAKGHLDGLLECGNCNGLDILNRLRTRPWLHLVGHVHSLAGQSGHTVNGCWPKLQKFFGIDLASRKATMFSPSDVQLWPYLHLRQKRGCCPNLEENLPGLR